jgi:putative acetyltransferase
VHERPLVIALDDPRRDDVLALLEEHLADMRATSPPESIHALHPDALASPEITFWTARCSGVLLGCAALKHHSPGLAEIKSMRTATASRHRGVARSLLDAVLDAARARGHREVSLETGSQDFFAPARSLYLRNGFVPCPPFADYRADPNSVFMTLVLGSGTPGAR